MKFGGQIYDTVGYGDLGGVTYVSSGGGGGGGGGNPNGSGGGNDTIRTFPIKTGRAFFNHALRAFPVS
jgi:hypothetical protein